ncbi:hypothetical protein ACTFIU_001640 [Dictyostelium citrinum]
MDSTHSIIDNSSIDQNNKKNILTTTTTLVKRVTLKNFDKEIINFENDLKEATFISIDTEFTGLGYQKGLKQEDIQEKYHAMINLVKQRSILEFGISIFKANFNDDKKEENNNNTSICGDYNQNNTKEVEDVGEAVTPPINNNSNDNDNNNSNNNDNSLLEKSYTIRVYNFIMLNISDFQVSPISMTFLSKHGFDFQELFLYGIPFQSKRPIHSTSTKIYNNNNNNNIINNHEDTLRRSKLLLDILTKSQLPSVIHNGIFDLLFIFQSLIGDLPDKLNDFISKILSVFPKIYDTKYIAEYKVNEKRSYLQYLFQKYERFNFKRLLRKETYATCNFKTFSDNDNDNDTLIPLINTEYSFIKPISPNMKICNDFADYGHCRLKDNCPDSHDISLVLDLEEHKNQKKKRGRNKLESNEELEKIDEEQEIKKTEGENIVSIVNNSIMENDKNNSNNNYNNKKYQELFKMEGQNVHSAGFDSALTGFIFVYYLLLFKNSNLQNEVENKIFLSGKQVPLVLKVSKYA